VISSACAGHCGPESGQSRCADGAPLMDFGAVDLAQHRIEQAAAVRRLAPAEVDAAFERARDQLAALGVVASELEATLPDRVEHAVRDGLRDQAQPLARQVAEIRGMMNLVIRKIEQIDGSLVTERNSRVDDLALLVDLIVSGWRSVDERIGRVDVRTAAGDSRVASLDERLTRLTEALVRMEERLERVLADKAGASVYRFDHR
jgi:uncharacterized coiled-coil protein SlyX